MSEHNSVRAFAPGVSASLGVYVYALRDPREAENGFVFYVGKGTANRVFDHFNEAEHSGSQSEKVERIRAIWAAGQDVEWFIVRRNIRALEGHETADESAEEIEAAVLDALAISRNGEALNDQSGKRAQLRGLVNSADVQALGAPRVNPTEAHALVLVFPIQNQLDKRGSPYEATRKTWSKSKFMQSDSVAVGLKNGVSRGVFRVSHWEPTNPGDAKMMFTGTELSGSDLLNKNWTAITSAASGYWQYGNYLAVEFDGHSRFRLLRGAKNKDWLDL